MVREKLVCVNSLPPLVCELLQPADAAFTAHHVPHGVVITDLNECGEVGLRGVAALGPVNNKGARVAGVICGHTRMVLSHTFVARAPPHSTPRHASVQWLAFCWNSTVYSWPAVIVVTVPIVLVPHGPTFR